MEGALGHLTADTTLWLLRGWVMRKPKRKARRMTKTMSRPRCGHHQWKQHAHEQSVLPAVHSKAHGPRQYTLTLLAPLDLAAPLPQQLVDLAQLVKLSQLSQQLSDAAHSKQEAQLAAAVEALQRQHQQLQQETGERLAVMQERDQQVRWGGGRVLSLNGCTQELMSMHGQPVGFSSWKHVGGSPWASIISLARAHAYTRYYVQHALQSAATTM